MLVRRSVFGVGVVLVLALVAAPAAAFVLAGTGTFAAAGCPAAVPVRAHESATEMGTWRFDYGFGCATSNLSFRGPWNPATGGCLPHILVANPGTFCMGPVSNPAQLTTVAISLCSAPGSCASGTADVVRL